MVVKVEDVSEILDVVAECTNMYMSDYAVQKINKMREFVLAGVTDGPTLRAIVEKYDKYSPVSMEIPEGHSYTELYKCAVSSQYAMDLLSACAKGERDFKTTQFVVTHAMENSEEPQGFCLVPYVENPEWSNTWISALSLTHKAIDDCIKNGYDILSYITPEHSPNGFEALALALQKGTGVPVNLSWYSDPYWRAPAIRAMVRLYQEHPEVHWGDFITSVTPVPAMLDALEKNMCGEDDFAIFRKFWARMSPKLEYVLNTVNVSNAASIIRQSYQSYKNQYLCDEDELAEHIADEQFIGLPDRLELYNKRFKALFIPDGAVEWLRANGSAALSKLSDQEVWEVGRDTYFNQHG